MLHFNFADNPAAQQDVHAFPLAAVVRVADSEVGVQIWALRPQAQFGVAKNEEVVVVGDGFGVPLLQFEVFAVGEGEDEPVLAGTLFAEGPLRPGSQHVPVAQLDEHHDLFLAIDVFVEVDGVEGV